MKRLAWIWMVLLLVSCVAASVSHALKGPDAMEIDAVTGGTWVPVQNHLSSTTNKTAYVLAEDGKVRVSAWRWDGAAWNQVVPNPAEANSDSVMYCPEGFVVPVAGQFDALLITGESATVQCQVQWYK